MHISKSIKLLEEIEGTGKAAEKGCHVTYNIRAFLNKGEEINVNYRNPTVEWPEGLITKDEKGELINFSCLIGKRESFAAVEFTLIGMKEGGYRKIKSPPQLAYRDGVLDKVPKNAIIIFEIWLRKLQCFA